MALVLANRVQETATANTTVSFTLTGAVPGFQSFAVIGNTNTTYYSATDASGNWEVGVGTYSTTGPTLDRTTVYASSNSGNAVTFSGAVNVFVTYPSGRSVNLNETGNVSALGTVSSGTWQGSTVGVAYGGTGVTASSGANSVVLRDANENITVNRLNQGLQNITASGGTTTLTAASDFNQLLTGTGNHTFRLPDATTLTDTTAFQFNNAATGTLTIQNNAGTTVGTVTTGGAANAVLISNATVGGTWEIHGYLPEGVTWGTNALDLGATVISNGTWQGGTIQPAYGGTGLTTFAGANNALYSTSASALVAGTLPVAAGGTGLTSYTLNGVVYASATNTLTTGSALTFDGNNLTQNGPNAAVSLQVNTANAGVSAGNYSEIQLADVGAVRSYWRNVRDGSGATIFSGNDHIRYALAGTEQMRLNSTGLGIGTSSPWSQLTVGSGGSANPASTVSFHKSTVSEYRLKLTSSLFNSDGAWLGLGFGYSDNYMKAAIIAEAKDANARANMHFALQADANSSNASLSDSKMVLTYSGNLGLGVTPPSGSSTPGIFMSGVTNIFGSTSNGITFAANAYRDAGVFKYVSSSTASRYSQEAGAHAWFTAPSGTAGNAITFTERMYLDSSGLGVYGAQASSAGRLSVSTSGGSSGNSAYFTHFDGSQNIYLQVQHSSDGIKLFNSSAGSSSNNLIFGNGTTSETMRISGPGNLSMAASGAITSSRINPRASSSASPATLTPDIQAADQYGVTALANALTINAPTGTPVDGNKLMFRILDNGTARALTWDATYTVIGTTLPTTTTANKTTYVGCVYNANNTRWDVVAVTTQA